MEKKLKPRGIPFEKGNVVGKGKPKKKLELGKFELEKKIFQLAPLALKVAREILKANPSELQANRALYLKASLADRILKKVLDIKGEKFGEIMPPKIEISFKPKPSEENEKIISLPSLARTSTKISEQVRVDADRNSGR